MNSSLKSSRILNYSKINRLNFRTVSTTYFNTHNGNSESNNGKTRIGCITSGIALTILIAHEINERRKNTVFLKELDNKDNTLEVGQHKPNLPNYTLEEVGQHSTKQTGIWVTYKQGVYDITNFVSEHPGGDHILLAAGSSVEPFWLLYGVHKNEHILALLETMRIGNVSLEESRHLTQDLSDPYGNEPRRHRILKAHSLKPYNAEPPVSLLVESFCTPNDIFYVRNHLPVPEIDPETYELEVEIEGKEGETLRFTLDDLKRLPKHTVTATVMCAGNRRSDMAQAKPVKGLNWEAGAVGNATWSGVRLRDILKQAGIDADSNFNHVQFEGFDVDGTGNPYGASIPIWKAVDRRGDVILAYEMNGEPLPRDHGFPIRAIVPGVVGARNVKWLAKITVSKQESSSHWQQNDYKGFCPSCDWDTVDFSKSPAIQELPIISAICKPNRGETVEVKEGHILVQGYAWSGGGQKIVRVDVTADGGDTWHVANLESEDGSEAPSHWSWTLWSVRIPVKDGLKTVEIWAKAVDSCYNTQPEDFKNIWNLRGVLSNAYHRVPVNLKYC